MHKANSRRTIAMLVASAAAMPALADTVDVGWRERNPRGRRCSFWVRGMEVLK